MKRRPSTLDIICKATVPAAFLIFIFAYLWEAGWEEVLLR